MDIIARESCTFKYVQKETTIERSLLTGCRCAAVSNDEKIYKWDSEMYVVDRWLQYGGNL